MNSDNKQIRDVANIAAQIMFGQQPVAEELKGGQVKLDKNHNGKIDGQDFKILKGEKKIKENLEDFSLEEIEEFMVSEEFEQLDELSKDTLKSYRVKSIGRAGSFENKGYEAGKKGGGAGSDKADKLFNKSDLVAAARKRAQEKMRKEEFVQEREDDEYHTPTRHHVQVQVSKGDGPKTHRKATVRAKEPKHAVSAAIAHYKQQGYTVHDHKYLGEDVEQIDELSKDTLHSYVKKSINDKENLNKPQTQKGLRRATSRLYKEEIDTSKYYDTVTFDEKLINATVELITSDTKKTLGKGQVAMLEEGKQIDEVKMADLPSTKVQGRAYGASKPEPHALDLTKGPKDKELKNIDAEKKKKFSEMVGTYKNAGLKSFMESLSKEEEEQLIADLAKEVADETMDFGEEVDNAQFTKELETNKAKASGKANQPNLAKGDVQAVQQEQTHTKVEFIDYNDVNGVKQSDIELGEDRMNDAEMEKREKIVKGMKKGLSGFKERYGARAKNVMYATATKRAMEK